MLNATTQIKRTIVLAGALVAVAAPSASARVADAQNVPSPVAASRTADPALPSSSLADVATHREAVATKQWQAGNPSTVIEVTSSPDGGPGLDLPSAGIGAAVPLTLALIEVTRKWVLRRRREHQVQHQLA